LEGAFSLGLQHGIREFILPLRVWVLGLEESKETHRVKYQDGSVERRGEVRHRKPLPPQHVEALIKTIKGVFVKTLPLYSSSDNSSSVVVTLLCSSTAADVADMDSFPDQVRHADEQIAKKVCSLAAKVFH
jgi:hypothetical protein